MYDHLPRMGQFFLYYSFFSLLKWLLHHGVIQTIWTVELEMLACDWLLPCSHFIIGQWVVLSVQISMFSIDKPTLRLSDQFSLSWIATEGQNEKLRVKHLKSTRRWVAYYHCLLPFLFATRFPPARRHRAGTRFWKLFFFIVTVYGQWIMVESDLP